jgi:hypothetical protein
MIYNDASIIYNRARVSSSERATLCRTGSLWGPRVNTGGQRAIHSLRLGTRSVEKKPCAHESA